MSMVADQNTEVSTRSSLYDYQTQCSHGDQASCLQGAYVFWYEYSNMHSPIEFVYASESI